MDCNFYIIATPIGNLSDITLRAIEILKEVDYIACEDTRITGILLKKYGIKTKVFNYHKFNEKECSEKIFELINTGKKIALVSDAGTPCISDPGREIIKLLNKKNIKISSIPGACAVTTFLTMIPRNNEEYAFIGFLPKNKNEQIEILNKYKYTNCIFYESPNRVIKSLTNIKESFGNIEIAIGRELTKIYEEIKTGKVEEIINYYTKNTLKGEIIIMIYQKENHKTEDEEIKDKINILKESGYTAKDISVIISKLYKENKNKIYNMALK